jgi:putative membrane protein
VDILIRYLHLFAVVILAGSVIIENMAIAKTVTKEDIHQLLKVDAAYGISAAVVLACGLALWLWVGKPSEFYNTNPLFHAKVALFILVGLLSIYPTVFFIRQRRNDSDSISVPNGVIKALRVELILLAIIPLLAFLMARGIGS